MTVHLSISSSNDRLPVGNWSRTWFGIGILFMACLLGMELTIRNFGWEPSVSDSKQLWAEQRRKASIIGKNAIILVGASRMQLDMDLDTIKQLSGLDPVQLAIDGTSYIPVLENLANDPLVNGTIILSIIGIIGRGRPDHKSSQWVNYYQKIQSQTIEPYKIIHNKISTYMENSLAIRLEGAKPATVIRYIVFKNNRSGNYLMTHQNRSIDADYKKVKMPKFYAGRLKRHFGKTIAQEAKTFKQFFSIYEKAITELKPAATDSFPSNLENLKRQIKKIEGRGGNVILVRLPTDKLIWQIDNRKYPKQWFWHEIEKQHEKSIHFSDFPELSNFNLPDGSHLDFRNKKAFTKNLMAILLKKQFLKNVNIEK